MHQVQGNNFISCVFFWRIPIRTIAQDLPIIPEELAACLDSFNKRMANELKCRFVENEKWYYIEESDGELAHENCCCQYYPQMSIVNLLNVYKSTWLITSTTNWYICYMPCAPWDLVSSSTHHYNDVIMGAMASQITSISFVYWTVCSGADQRKHQSSASLAFVRGIHRGPVNSPHKWPITRKIWWRHHGLLVGWPCQGSACYKLFCYSGTFYGNDKCRQNDQHLLYHKQAFNKPQFNDHRLPTVYFQPRRCFSLNHECRILWSHSSIRGQ